MPTLPGFVSAALLAAGQTLNVTPASGGVQITVPVKAPDELSSTVVLKIKGHLR